MTMNRLTSGLVEEARELQPGETRTITDAKSGRSWTVYRADRPYVHDLADAYNAGMSAEAKKRGLQWFVTPAGELKLGDDAEWSRHNRRRNESRTETERARYLRRQFERDGA